MNNAELIRRLSSIGKTIFVNEFDLLRNYSRGKVTNANAIQQLVSNDISIEAGPAIRCSKVILKSKKVCCPLRQREQI